MSLALDSPDPLGPLNNMRLREAPLPSVLYNQLPHIDDMAAAAAQHARAHAILLGIIASHGLAAKFSIHLVHKHFDLAQGRVMVYETVRGKTHGDFILCSPRVSQDTPNLRGLYFKAAQDGSMFAYEFTTEKGLDLSAHEGFVSTFAAAILRLGVQDVFALTALSICPSNKILTEFELGQVASTVLVADTTWLPAVLVGTGTTTDWLATADYAQHAEGSVPGIIQLKCTKTRSQSHYNVTCSTTRKGSHLGHAPDPFGGQAPEDNVLKIDGEVVPDGTEGHAIITHALQMVTV